MKVRGTDIKKDVTARKIRNISDRSIGRSDRMEMNKEIQKEKTLA